VIDRARLLNISQVPLTREVGLVAVVTVELCDGAIFLAQHILGTRPERNGKTRTAATSPKVEKLCLFSLPISLDKSGR
jgi:hypothetical protein